jgi:hypothetical protein
VASVFVVVAWGWFGCGTHAERLFRGFESADEVELVEFTQHEDG